MAPSAVRFHPAAAQEVESTYDWYAARDNSAAQGFREELRRVVDEVAANPQAWPRYGSGARRYVFPRYPFSLVYIIRAGVALMSSLWPTVGGDLDLADTTPGRPLTGRLSGPALNRRSAFCRAQAGRSAQSR
jgi:plasmid stabilization system protein ParE